METRKAIPPHSTPTTDAPWDGPAMVARIPNDAGRAILRRMFAWVDPAGDPDRKSSYKFPHHMVAANGRIGAANVRACLNGIQILNGARGGAKIPDADRPAVWRHLARHLRDAGIEPPSLRSLAPFEVRDVSASFEVADAGVVRGYAALFDQKSLPLSFGYRERIAPTAFDRSLRDGADVWALFAHQPDRVLGRRKSGTLVLDRDERGLRFELTLPDTPLGREVRELVRRGDVDQMSFGFVTRRDRWEQDGEEVIRVLEDVELREVSITPMPAYTGTSVTLVRSAILTPDDIRGIPDADAAAAATVRARAVETSLRLTLEILRDVEV